jgi:hypothetical protein
MNLQGPALYNHIYVGSLEEYSVTLWLKGWEFLIPQISTKPNTKILLYKPAFQEIIEHQTSLASIVFNLSQNIRFLNITRMKCTKQNCIFCVRQIYYSYGHLARIAVSISDSLLFFCCCCLMLTMWKFKIPMILYFVHSYFYLL